MGLGGRCGHVGAHYLVGGVMAARINFNAEREAERVLEDVLHCRNWTAETRDALADRLEQIVLRAFNDAGMKVVNENRK